MSTSRWPVGLIVIVLSGVIGILLSHAVSQEQSPPRHCDLAVLDVSMVFEKHTEFQKEMEGLKDEVAKFEVEMKAAGQEMLEKKQQLGKLPKDSEEFRKIEEEMARANSDMQLEVAKKRRTFLDKEAVFYARGYHQLEEAVRAIAARKEIRLVVRFSAEPINDKDRNSVLQAVNRPIVFQDQLDITDDVIKAINAP
jgi:Skp family chaperone for outer membrane proteins